MHGFLEPLTLTEMGLNWKLWKLEHPFVYERPNGAKIIVPANFETDGASVPELLWDLLPAWGTYSRAAVVHDWLCFLLHYGDAHPEAPTRAHADAIFFEAMGVCGTNRVTKWVLYWGVRIGAHLGGTNIVDDNNPDFIKPSPIPAEIVPVAVPVAVPVPVPVVVPVVVTPPADGAA